MKKLLRNVDLKMAEMDLISNNDILNDLISQEYFYVAEATFL